MKSFLFGIDFIESNNNQLYLLEVNGDVYIVREPSQYETWQQYYDCLNYRVELLKKYLYPFMAQIWSNCLVINISQGDILYSLQTIFKKEGIDVYYGESDYWFSENALFVDVTYDAPVSKWVIKYFENKINIQKIYPYLKFWNIFFPKKIKKTKKNKKFPDYVTKTIDWTQGIGVFFFKWWNFSKNTLVQEYIIPKVQNFFYQYNKAEKKICKKNLIGEHVSDYRTLTLVTEKKQVVYLWWYKRIAAKEVQKNLHDWKLSKQKSLSYLTNISQKWIISELSSEELMSLEFPSLYVSKILLKLYKY